MQKFTALRCGESTMQISIDSHLLEIGRLRVDLFSDLRTYEIYDSVGEYVLRAPSLLRDYVFQTIILEFIYLKKSS